MDRATTTSPCVVALFQAVCQYNTATEFTATTANRRNWAVPVVMFLLLPFVLALRHGHSFWAAYALDCVWLVPGFFLHKWLTALIG